MSDIDFEELDKAVNSLVGGSPKDEKKEQTSESNEAPKSVGSVSKPEATPTSPNLPSRRAGRFMDMKHDSSDMTKDNSPSLITSTKTTIAPISKNIKAEPKSDAAAIEETAKNDWSESKEGGSDDDEEHDNTTSPDTNMPDPIDHFESKQKETDDKSEESSKESDNKPDKHDEPERKFEETDNKRDEHEKDDSKPSPFIDDAKVEKRPLGGFSSESPVDPPKKDEESKDGEEQTVEAPATPIELPPELDKNLVAIEAGEAPEVTKVPEADSVIPETDEDDKKAESSEKEDTKESKKDEKPAKDTKQAVSQLLATASSGSIPDQYKRENRSHELHTDHPLFDSEHLKAIPVSAPKKPKSTAAKVFQWIFIALGLLLLGGSLGAAIFVFVSQS